MNAESITPGKTSRLVRVLRWLGLGVLALITLVALLYAVENFRGKRAWERYRAEAAKRGVVFEFSTLVPPEVPDDQNAAQVPLIQSWFDPRFGPKGDPTLWPDAFERAQKHVASDKDKTVRRLTDLVAWEQAFAAAEVNEKKSSIRRQARTPEEQARAATNVLAALQVYEPALEQLREGAKRPQTRFPVDYNAEQPFAVLLPHLASIRGVTAVLNLRATASLAAGRTDAAFQDVLLQLRLVEMLENEHFLISYLVRVACLHVAAQPIWEGCMEHRWSDAQLQTLQERVARLDFLRGLLKALETERAAGMTTIDWIKTQGNSAYALQQISDPNTPVSGDGVNLTPRGWWDMEKVSYGRIFENQAAPVLAALTTGTLADAPRSVPGGKELHHGLAALWHHEVMASMLLPAVDKVQRKAGMAQALVDEIVTACALERARLAAGSYPQSLATLTPALLNKPSRDVMTGQPLLYRTEGEGYVLYSVGWNRTDDGGVPGKTMFDDERGDWVWRVTP